MLAALAAATALSSQAQAQEPKATLQVPDRLYVGYLGAFAVEDAADRDGRSRVILQRRAGGGWAAVTSEPRRSGATELRASVSTFCFGASAESNMLVVVAAKLDPVRIAPDGAVVGVLRTKDDDREVLVGRLRNERFTGTIDVSLSTCNGQRKLTAVRARGEPADRRAASGPS